MKKYQNNPDGKIYVQNGAFDFTKTSLEKNLSVIGGEGDWKYIVGYKVFVDPDGFIVKGMDPLIGRNYEDLAGMSDGAKMAVQMALQSLVRNIRKSTFAERESDYSKSVKQLDDYIERQLEEVMKSRELKQGLQFAPSPNGAVYNI